MTSEDWADFKSLEITQIVFRAIEEHLQEYALSVAHNSAVMDSVESSAMTVARSAGYIDGVRTLLDGDFVEGEPLDE